MDLLKKLFKIEKDEKNSGVLNWFILLSIGLILFFLSNTFSIPKDKKNDTTTFTQTITPTEQKTYEKVMENRLKEILSKVNGAGNVEVMLTISYGKEIVIADDISKDESISQEKDNTGGTRDVKNYKEETKVIMHTPQNGITTPVVLKEIEPKIEGVIIVSEGGDDVIVQDNLRKAAQALFNIPVHKIEVFKMK